MIISKVAYISLGATVFWTRANYFSIQQLLMYCLNTFGRKQMRNVQLFLISFIFISLYNENFYILLYQQKYWLHQLKKNFFCLFQISVIFSKYFQLFNIIFPFSQITNICLFKQHKFLVHFLQTFFFYFSLAIYWIDDKTIDS